MAPKASFLSLLSEAVATPHAIPMPWPVSIEPNQPIRKAFTHIRLFPNVDADAISEAIEAETKKGKDGNWLDAIFWWVIALGLSNENGESAFKDSWPEIQDVSPRGKTIDYKVIGVYLQKEFDNLHGLRLIRPVFEEIMVLNGFMSKREDTDAKK